MARKNVTVEMYLNDRTKFGRLSKTVGDVDLKQGEASILKNEFNMDDFRKQTHNSDETLTNAYLTQGNGESETQKAYELLGIYKDQNLSTLDTVLNDMNRIKSVLTGHYFNTPEMIQKFGFIVNKGKSSTPNIKLPKRSINMFLPAVKKTIKRHEELGDKSPLANFDMKKFTTRVIQAEEHLAKARDLHDDAEELFDEAIKSMGFHKDQNVNTKGTLYYTLASIRDFLLFKFKGTEEELEKWGFNVVISMSKKPEQKPVEV